MYWNLETRSDDVWKEFMVESQNTKKKPLLTTAGGWGILIGKAFFFTSLTEKNHYLTLEKKFS